MRVAKMVLQAVVATRGKPYGPGVSEARGVSKRSWGRMRPGVGFGLHRGYTIVLLAIAYLLVRRDA